MGTATIVLSSWDSQIPTQKEKSLSQDEQMFCPHEEEVVDGARTLPRLSQVTHSHQTRSPGPQDGAIPLFPGCSPASVFCHHVTEFCPQRHIAFCKHKSLAIQT